MQNEFRKHPNHAVIKRYPTLGWNMRTKALTLALLMFASALAGCFGEDAEDSIDSADDIIVDDRSGNETANAQDAEGELDIELVPTNPDDCNSGGGTWIEASERGGESYCDIGAEDVQRVVCELANETWLQTIHHDDEPCERGLDNDCDNIDEEYEYKGHSHSHSHGDVTHSHTHTHGGYCDTENPEVLEALRSNCEFMGGNWTSTNGTVERGDNSTNESWWECSLHDGDEEREEREITQEDCERRGGNWTAAPDRGDEYYYCDFGEENSEITQEDCERRGGNWTEAPDRPDVFYCVFDRDESGNNNNSSDGTGNSTTNNSAPVITLIGDEEMSLMASLEDNFEDPGANCIDEEEGDISMNVEVSGDMVNMGDAGEFLIFYNCQDSDGNEAEEVRRRVTVLVEDTDGDGVYDHLEIEGCMHETAINYNENATEDDESCVFDTDGDGVPDHLDAFPDDARETADSDGDGVGDNADECDDTEAGATVGEDGCEEAEPQVHFIDISGMAFSPNTLTISVGDTVTWTNQDGAPHSATGDNGEFDSGTLNNGQNFSFTFTAAGTYTYHCSVHNGMTATIIVE